MDAAFVCSPKRSSVQEAQARADLTHSNRCIVLTLREEAQQEACDNTGLVIRWLTGKGSKSLIDY